MLTKLKSVLLLALLTVSLSVNATLNYNEPDTFVPGQIVVIPNAGVHNSKLNSILSKHNATQKRVGNTSIHIVKVPTGLEQTIVEALSRNKNFKSVELDKYLKTTLIPDDPLYPNAWHLPIINAPQAWDHTQGAGVTVAILDQGIRKDHVDLATNLLVGWNFYDNTPDTTDVFGHGTLTAGTTGALTNNTIGVAGTAGQVKILPLKITNPTNGWASCSAIASAISHAADNGARVASISFLNIMGCGSTINAAAYMQSKNGVVVVAAGNTGALEFYNNTPTATYVSATGSTDVRTSWSSYGDYVDVAAPGQGIWTTNNSGTYSSVSGTSFSTPITAGVVAMMMSANPNMPNHAVVNALYSSAADLGTVGKDQFYGHGRVDAEKAVLAALAYVSTEDNINPTVGIQSPLDGGVVSSMVVVAVDATDNVGISKVELSVNGNHVSTDTSSPYTFSWDSTSIQNGTVVLSAKAFDTSNNTSTDTISISVDNPIIDKPIDTEDPIIEIVTPVPGEYDGKVDITVHADDNYPTATLLLEIFADNRRIASGYGNSLNTSWNTKPRRISGSQVITAVATDEAGNSAETSVTIQVTGR